MRSPFLSLGLAVFILGCAGPQRPNHLGDSRVGGNADVEATVNNNAPMMASVTSTAKGQVFEFKNEPYIELAGTGFTDGPKSVVIVTPEVIMREQATSQGGKFKIRIPLGARLLDVAQGLDVSIGEEFHRRLRVKVARLHGTVRFFDGRPVPSPIVSVQSSLDVAACGNEVGEYEVLLPPRRIDSLAVWDRGYSTSTLETWLSDVALTHDLDLDIRVGEMEVYSLRAWTGTANTTFVFFVPMSLARVRALKANGVAELEVAQRAEAWPHLAQGDVRVFLDQTEAEVGSFREVEDVVQVGGVTIRRPAYLLVLPAQDPRGKVIKVEIQHSFRGSQQEVVERGEGFYLGFL